VTLETCPCLVKTFPQAKQIFQPHRTLLVSEEATHLSVGQRNSVARLRVRKSFHVLVDRSHSVDQLVTCF